jgi:hypothetical protein
MTGYDYVVLTEVIYEIDSSTGEIGAQLTQACGDVQISNALIGVTITDVTGISGYSLTGTIASGESRYGTHTSFTGNIQLSVTGVTYGTALLIKDGSLINTKPVSSTITFDSFTFAIGEHIIIQLTP